MAFQIYDFDQDHYVSDVDLFTLLKNNEKDDECFLQAFADDITSI